MPELEQLPDVLTISELQKVLRIGRSTAYRLIKTKELPCVRIGRSIRIPKEYIREFVEAQCEAVEDDRDLCYDKKHVTAQTKGLSEERRMK